ncbi:MAG: hypothetical protein OEW42_17395 [Acidimicrobiia bacterium]|nr:hypothetical protein [Acidimicrobiia bacterium]
MRKTLMVAVLVVALSGLAALPAAADPPGLPSENPNKNAIVVPITCDGFNDDQPFMVWIPNANAFPQAGSVGHPIGVDVPLGVQKFVDQGSFPRTVECETPLGTAYIMPTGRP